MGFWFCDTCKENVEVAALLSDIPEDLNGVIACFAYTDPKIRTLTASYKYRSATVFEETQKELLERWVHAHSLPLWAFDEKAVVIPIPSPETRIQARGINHTLQLAKTIKSAFQLPSTIRTVLGRKEHTTHNADLAHDERILNVKETFVAFGEIPEKIILVDDVLTTGSTLSEAARILKMHGAKEVYAIVFARS